MYSLLDIVDSAIFCFMETCDIDFVVEAVRAARARDVKVTLVLGAGCSKSGGIPTADEFTSIVRQRYRTMYESCKTRSYAECMTKIGPVAAKELVRDAIDQCKVNAAHICVAGLLDSGIVDRVLTPNFDPLILKACAHYHFLPAVYDLRMSSGMTENDLARAAYPAVFHLHGQHTAFTLLQGEEELSAHAENIRPLILDRASARCWIIVGYSGKNDPLVKLLGETDSFDSHLFWIAYHEETPSEIVDRDLLHKQNAHVVTGYDADRFFVSLGNRLECFPPPWLVKPFSHLQEILEQIAEFPLWYLPTTNQGGDILDELWADLARSTLSQQGSITNLYRDEIKRAVDELEGLSKPNLLLASFSQQAGNYTAAAELEEKVKEKDIGADYFRNCFGMCNLGLAYQLQKRTRASEGNDNLDIARRGLAAAERAHKLLPELDPSASLVAEFCSYIALKHEPSDRRQLLDRVDAVMGRLSRRQPSDGRVWLVWGHLTGRHAVVEKDVQKKRMMFELAIDRLKAAVKCGVEEETSAFVHLSTLLLLACQFEPSRETENLSLRQAKWFAEDAYTKGDTESAYNLACIYARLEDEVNCRRYLSEAVKLKKWPRSKFENDPDFQRVKDQQWFRNCVALLLNTQDGSDGTCI